VGKVDNEYACVLEYVERYDPKKKKKKKFANQNILTHVYFSVYENIDTDCTISSHHYS
jgi:hypothetical protein